MFNRYYESELQFLRELGEEFSSAHPAAAHMLAGPGRDPDVERLLEGFAFLTARVREKLDDEFPELTHALMSLLWPHYLRPVPSLSVLEFAPVMQALRNSQRVSRGTEVDSVPVEGTPCRFRTCYDVKLHPLSLEQAVLGARATGPSSLKLTFRLWNQAKLDQLDLEPLRLYLHGEPALTTTLYGHLGRHVEEIRVASNATALERGPYRTLTLTPVGFAEDQALLPYPSASPSAYRLLQEYFALPEKFMFVDLHGLSAIAGSLAGDRFEIEVRFDRALDPALRPTRDEIRLYCTPIANLFPHDADPFRVDGAQTEYRLRPSGRDPFHFEIFSVDRVATHAAGTAEEQPVLPFYAFDRAFREGGRGGYLTRLRQSVVDERLDTYVSFVDPEGQVASPEAETVSLTLTCTNRRLPEALRVGDIQVPTDSSPAFVGFRNLTAPTPSVVPPLDGDLPWRLISHLSLNYLPLTDLEALRGVLQLYNLHAVRDPRAARAHRLRVEGIHAIRATPIERLERGALLRGAAITIELLEDHFAGDGDLYLFGTLLNEFFSLHTTLNSFTQVTARGIQKGEVVTWPPRTGRGSL